MVGRIRGEPAMKGASEVKLIALVEEDVGVALSDGIADEDGLVVAAEEVPCGIISCSGGGEQNVIFLEFELSVPARSMIAFALSAGTLS